MDKARDGFIGAEGEGFAFDNEGPAHRVFLESYELAEKPVTNGEWLAFMEEGGYGNALHWLSAGWAWVQSHSRASGRL